MLQLQPWDIRTDDTRKEDSLVTFIVFCEDEVSEPTYFRTFNSDTVKVNEIPGQRSKKLNLDKTISKCTEMGLVHFCDDRHKVDEKIKEKIWCVYDRDVEHTDMQKVKKEQHVSFDTAITTGKNAGLQVAWSNDCFELWVLLHFEDISPTAYRHREYLYERLTGIFKSLHGTIPGIDEIVAHSKFSYKDTFKSKEKFTLFVLPFLKDYNRRNDAINRAKALYTHHQTKALAYHSRNPCTLVFNLVEAMLAV